MKYGTKVRTLYLFSETGTIVKPRARYGEGIPEGGDWFMIKFDRDGSRAGIHREMFVVRNED